MNWPLDWHPTAYAANSYIMHVLFIHKNFPAQFGHIAKHLIDKCGFRCTFVSEKKAGFVAGIERIQYQLQGGASAKSHPCSQSFENQIWHSAAAFEALADRRDIQPDLIVGHSGFVSTIFLRELYDCPIINYFEYFYRTRDSDMDFRRDLPAGPVSDLLRARARNAVLLLDLENCDAGYSPTDWQRSRLPEEFQPKLRTIFDGIDHAIWRPIEKPSRKVGSWTLPADKRVVTYVSRGMESMRGFDIFMKFAKRLCDQRSDVLIVVVGEDRVAYGGDSRLIGDKTFKQWVLSQDDYDLSRILFVGRLPAPELANLFSISDLHIYLTVPFVLSWSLMNALACGALVLASDTPPVREMVQDHENGLLVDFFDIDRMVMIAHDVLSHPRDYAALRTRAQQFILDDYTVDRCLPKMLDLYMEVANDVSQGQ